MRPSPALTELLVAHQRQFLAFLEPRVGSREAARDVLQAALLRSLEKGHQLRDGESAHAWFYRLLRNALIDRARTASLQKRALEQHAHQSALDEEAARALKAQVCGCVRALGDAVKPEYALAVRRVDLEGASLDTYAQEQGITPGNARVRLHRARSAMGEKLLAMCGTCCAQGCTNCPCEAPKP